MKNQYSNRLYLSPSAHFLEDKNMGTFNLPVDVYISFKEAITGPPKTIYINHPKNIKPDLSSISGIQIVPFTRISNLTENKILKIPSTPRISSANYKLLSNNDYFNHEGRTKIFEVRNPDQVVVVHITRTPCAIYTSPFKKYMDGILGIEKGIGIRNMTELISDSIIEISKQLLQEFNLDTAAIAFETDNKSLRLIDVNPSYVPVTIKRLYEIAIPHMILAKALQQNKLWLPRMNLRNVEEQIQEHRNERFQV